MLATVGILQGIVNVHRCFEEEIFCVAGLCMWRSLSKRDDIKLCSLSNIFSVLLSHIWKTKYLVWFRDWRQNVVSPSLSLPILVIDHFKIFRHSVETICSELCSIWVLCSIEVTLSSFFRFLRIIFWVISKINWYVNRKEFLLKKTYKYIIIVKLGPESEKKFYILSTVSLKCLLQKLAGWIFPGKLKKPFFFWFAHDNLKSVPFGNLNYMLMLVTACIFSFSLVLTLCESHNSQITVLSLMDWTQALLEIMYHDKIYTMQHRTTEQVTPSHICNQLSYWL